SLGAFTPQSPPVCPSGTCISLDPLPPPGFNILHLLPNPGFPLLSGPTLSPVVLGGFFSSTFGVQLLPGDSVFGYTALGESGPLDVSIKLVPEPEVGALVLLALAALGWVRRRVDLTGRARPSALAS